MKFHSVCPVSLYRERRYNFPFSFSSISVHSPLQSGKIRPNFSQLVARIAASNYKLITMPLFSFHRRWLPALHDSTKFSRSFVCSLIPPLSFVIFSSLHFSFSSSSSSYSESSESSLGRWLPHRRQNTFFTIRHPWNLTHRHCLLHDAGTYARMTHRKSIKL